MIEKVEGLLLALKYKASYADKGLIRFALDKVTDCILNDINHTTLPKELENIAASRALGEFLMTKKTFDPDSLTELDLTAGVKQLTEGDKSTTFSTGEGSQTDEQRLDAFINTLINYGEGQLSCFRRIRW